MTIVAAVKTRDCLVLGTDSVSSVLRQGPEGQPQFVKSYSNATKLFQLENFPIAVATWGAGNIGPRSIGGLVAEHGHSLSNQPRTVQEAANGLDQFVAPIYNQTFSAIPLDQQPLLGFFVGGYSQRQPLPELWEVRFPGASGMSRVSLVRGQNDFGGNWRGIELPFTRLHLGYDPRIIDGLTRRGVAPEIANNAVKGYESPVIFDAMPIQDAINFCGYILRTTILFANFEVGVPSCGEPIQVAVITTTQGFSWVEELKFHV